MIPLRSLLALCVFGLSAFEESGLAQNVQILHSWQSRAGYPSGSLLKASNGNFYVPTERGGEDGYGTIVEVTPAGVTKVIHSFGTAGGLYPEGPLAEGPDGFLYGVARQGGFNLDGVFFKISPAGDYSIIREFYGTGTAYPAKGLIRGADGNFYGTTTSGNGSVYRLTAAGQFTIVFRGSAANGIDPSGRLLDRADGYLYGVTASGGANDRGTIFKTTPTGQVTVLHQVTVAEGQALSGLTDGGDGNLYGTTRNVFYRLTPQGEFTPLYTFASATGSVPRGELVLASDGFFYGTTIRGGATGYGVVYRVSKSGQFTRLADLDKTGDYASVIEKSPGVLLGVKQGSSALSSEGAIFEVTTQGAYKELTDFIPVGGLTPSGPLVEGEGGNLFSTTNYYNTSSGTLYRVAPSGTVTTLAEFPYFGEVGQSRGGVTVGPDRFLYGLSRGSSGNEGVVYKAPQNTTNSTQVTVLRAMTGANDSERPHRQLIAGPDSRFYGTSEGYPYGYGTVFSITSTGTYKRVVEFRDSNGLSPNGLVLAGDGNFYGTTGSGGTDGRGTVFRVVPGATPVFTTLTNFNITNGQAPTGALLARPDGSVLGTTTSGGTNNLGTVFKITAAGAQTLYANLSAIGASHPVGALTAAADGNVYGVTADGGASGVGCVYRLTPAGSLALVHSFSSTGPRRPAKGLTLGPDNALYGTTTAGGTNQLGSAFRVTTSGAITHLRHFDYKTGYTPVSEIFRASDGALYALNEIGGTSGGGTLLRIENRANVSLADATEVALRSAKVNGTVNPNGSPTTVSFEYGTTASLGSSTAAVNIGSGTTNVSTTAPLTGLAPGTQYFFRLVAVNSWGAQRSNLGTFTTAPLVAPTVTTAPASLVTIDSARLHGAASARGTESATFFERADQPGEAQWIGGTPATVGPDAVATSFDAKLSGLEPHKTYTFRAIARNDGGVAFGEWESFSTLNTPPIAHNDTFHPTSTQFSIPATANDTDADGDTVTIESVDAGAHGSVELVDGTIRYTGSPTFSGNDQFSYVISDGFGGTATGSVTLVNANPEASQRVLHPGIAPGGTMSIDVSALVADPDGDALQVVALSEASHAIVTFDGMTLIYGPAGQNFTGNDSFTYTVSDGAGARATATITLQNAAPIASPDSILLTTAGGPQPVIANDTDIDGDSLTIIATDGASFGSVTTDGTTVTYVPNERFEGVDTFTYTVTDGRGAKATTSVSVKATYPFIRVLAETGANAPGTATTWARFGHPSLTGQGAIAGWLATVREGGRPLQVIVHGPLGAPSIALRQTDAVPNRAGRPLPGVEFTRFREPVFAGPDFAVVASVKPSSGSSEVEAGIWVQANGLLRAVANEGEKAPGADNSRYLTFKSIAMPAPGLVFFVARLKPYTDPVYRFPKGENDFGLWVWNAETETTRLVVRNGQSFNLGDRNRVVHSFRILEAVAGSSAHPRYNSQGLLEAVIKFRDLSEALATIDRHGEIQLQRVTQVAGAAGQIPVEVGAPSGGAAAVRYKGGQRAVFDFEDGQFIATNGENQTAEGPVIFKRFFDPVTSTSSSGSSVAFRAKTSDEQGGRRDGIWSTSLSTELRDSENLVTIARTGDAAPEAQGAIIGQFRSLSIVPDRGPIFTAQVMDPVDSAPTGNLRGCWAVDSTGVLQKLLKEGDIIGGKIIRRLAVLEAVAGSPGQGRAWAFDDPTPSIIARVTFSDGADAIVLIALP